MIKETLHRSHNVVIGSFAMLALAASAHAEIGFTPITVDNPDPQAGAGFGQSLAGVGDVDQDGVPDFLVGSRYQDVDGHVDQGRAYLFSGADQRLLLSFDNPTPQNGSSFGRWTSRIGDVNRDGVPDLLIGAPFQMIDGKFQAGQAFVFSGSNGSLIYTLNDPTAEPIGHFGLVVSGIADITRDNVPDIFVGAHFKDIDGNVDQGRAFIFDGATGQLFRVVDNPNPGPNAFFGFPVATLADIDGDGVSDLLIGAAKTEVNGHGGQGRAYVFSGDSGALLLSLDDPDPQTNAAFGRSLVGLGDVNRDSVADIAVGAHLQQVGDNVAQGRVYVFSGADGSLLRRIDNPKPAARASFGYAVGVVGDVNGDQVSDILAGAPLARVGNLSKAGLGYIFSGASGALLHVLHNPNNQPAAQFGRRIVGLGGDMNGDGLPDVLVGAYQQDAYAQAAPRPETPSEYASNIHVRNCPLDDGMDDWGADAENVTPNANEGQAFVFASHR